MKVFSQSHLYYVPRVLATGITLFFAVFILEGFSPEFSWMDSIMHLVPTLIAFVFTVVAWKKPAVGGWLFIVLGLFWIVMLRVWNWNALAIGGIPVVTGVLFLATDTAPGEKSARIQKKRRP